MKKALELLKQLNVLICGFGFWGVCRQAVATWEQTWQQAFEQSQDSQIVILLVYVIWPAWSVYWVGYCLLEAEPVSKSINLRDHERNTP